jgi:hypothetical protein
LAEIYLESKRREGRQTRNKRVSMPLFDDMMILVQQIKSYQHQPEKKIKNKRHGVNTKDERCVGGIEYVEFFTGA